MRISPPVLVLLFLLLLVVAWVIHAKVAKTAKATTGGAEKHWTDYESWDELVQNKAATEEYLRQRAAVLSRPDLDWTRVTSVLAKKLKKPREYIGIANVESDGKTVTIKSMSSGRVGTGGELYFAALPGNLVAEYTSRPAMFIFHTHPCDERCHPFPSGHDLVTQIALGAAGRYAAGVVISRYGVLMYGLDAKGYDAIQSAKDKRQAMLNLQHDVVAAHEAIRGWSNYTNDDLIAFYKRHRMFLIVYPTPAMVGDSQQQWSRSLESSIDYELIAERAAAARLHQAAKLQQKNRATST